MAEKSTIARPYAEAVFQLAQESGQLKEWSAMLQTVVLITADEDMQRIIGNTSVSKSQIADLIIDIAGSVLDTKGQNFVKLLAENRRLGVATEISVQYEILKAEAEKTIEAEVVAASELGSAQQEQIINKLKVRLGCEVSLKCTVDDSLMGGAVIKAGDLVIDGSVSGHLNKLSVELAG